MLLTVSAVAVTGGTLVGGAKVYADHKKKKERPWTYALEKLNKRNNKANLVGNNLAVVEKSENVKKGEQKAGARRVISSSYNKVRRINVMLFGLEDEPSLFDKLLAPLLGKQRQQLEEITGQKYEKSAQEKRMQRGLGVASLNIGIAGMSLLYPPLIWLAIPGLLYAYAPYSKLAYQGFKERRVSSYVLDAILLGGMLFGGYFYTKKIDSFVTIFYKNFHNK